MLNIIAEIGSTWKRDTEAQSKQAALDSIAKAAECGANIVKFQLFRAELLYNIDRAPKQYQAFEEYELPYEWLPELKAQCKQHGVEFWLSVFDIYSLHQAQLWIDGIKIASGDVTYTALLEEISKMFLGKNLPIALSTGASKSSEVVDALTTLKRYDPDRNLIVMNCVSQYPASIFDYSLGWKPGRVGKRGLSDHTITYDLAKLALANGYTYFEKHFSLEYVGCPDMVVSFTPRPFRIYCDNLKEIEKLIEPVFESKQVDFGERQWARRGRDGLRPKVSIRGKYKDVQTSSDDFAKRKETK